MKKLLPFIILFLATVILTGCVSRLIRPERPRPHFAEHWEEREIARPVVVSVEDDKVVVVEERERVLIAGREAPPEPRQGIIRRALLWLAGLSLIYLIIALVAGPGIIVSIVVWKIRVARRMKRAVAEIVKGIKKSEAIKHSSSLHDCLKDETSTETKKIIGEIKATL